ncbi:MAG: pyridoxal phosphate-dependent aminotransferase [Myxococcota bacterium]|nr:pyridoxal phosphate-dependent aminotransferase [Myxococcota bacterium]
MEAPYRPRLADRISRLEPFLAMEVMERAFQMEAEGLDVVHLEIGEPAAVPPLAASQAMTRALAEGETSYSDSRGLWALREAIAADYEVRFGAQVDPHNVLVTSGTSPALLLAFSLLLNPGDEVVVPAPVYPCYPNFIRFCGGSPVFVPTRPEEGFAIDVDRIVEAVTPRTRAILVNSPCNPTGAIQSRETLENLSQLGLPIFSDEIYDGLTYDGRKVASASALDVDAFVFDGFSKRYAMTGFRLGWAVVPDWATRPLQIMQQNFFISANRFVQHAGLAALKEGREEVEAMRAGYQRKRDLLVSGLRRLGFGVPTVPEGAFYVLADARVFGEDSRRLADCLLERARVGTAPGIDFGPEGEGMLRFCYAVEEGAIEEALQRLEPVLEELRVGSPATPEGKASR